MTWADSKFPDADDPDDVEYMIMYWRTVPCPTGNCAGKDYRLESRQFDHLPKGTSLGQAKQKLKEYSDNRKGRGDNPGRKNHSLFLCQVVEVAHINDHMGGVIND
jgi:hypothetical protein